MTPEQEAIEAAQRAVQQAQDAVLMASDELRPQRQQALDEARVHVDELKAAQERAHVASERTTAALLDDAREGPQRRARARVKAASAVKRRIARAERDKPLTSAQRLIKAAGGDPYATPPDPMKESTR